MPPKIITSKRDARALWELDIVKPRHPWFQAMQESCGQSQTFEEFLQRDYLLIGVWDNRREMAGGFILSKMPNTLDFNVHVAVRNRAALPEMELSAITVRNWLFRDEYASRLYLWSVRQNFPMNALARRTGFTETGLSMMLGSYKGRPFEWVQFLLARDPVSFADA